MRDQLRDPLQLEGQVRGPAASHRRRPKGLEHENRLTQTDERDLSLENATLSKVIAKTALRPPAVLETCSRPSGERSWSAWWSKAALRFSGGSDQNAFIERIIEPTEQKCSMRLCLSHRIRCGRSAQNGYRVRTKSGPIQVSVNLKPEILYRNCLLDGGATVLSG